ncbi:hypothetical protein [Rhizobium sp. Root483D2]|uniref:hypothetical protein n=1 Tax=Rhizobium sp. Root483D2 TaxID=1736545 RepID=UPI0007617B29|nr:hypothetical protein [Rhizobium sp. Root483D2]
MMSCSDGIKPNEGNDGFGLITALMFVLLVAAVITPLAVLGRGQVLASAYSTRRTAFELLSPGLSLVAYAGQPKSPILTGWQQCMGDGKVFYLHIQDQNGLIGLNSASNALLKIGFLSLGYIESDATRFADRIEIYREIGSDEPGTDKDAAFIVKHAPFENIAELYDVLTPPLPDLGKIARIFTIQNKTDTVTIAHSPPALRRQLERHDQALQFAAAGNLPSGHAEISFAEFKAGEPSGFLSTVMLASATGDGASPNILQKETVFTSLSTLDLDPMAPMPCPDLLKRLTEGL